VPKIVPEQNPIDCEKSMWHLLYLLASNLNLQMSHEGLLESVSKSLIRETDYVSIHWHWVKNNTIIPSQKWAFRQNDLAPHLTRLTNSSAPELQEFYALHCQTAQESLHMPLPNLFAPYQHAVLLPFKSEGQTIAVLQLFSLEPISDLQPQVSQWGNHLVSEINRQLDLILWQERERDQVVQLAQASRLSSLGAMAGGIAHEINNPLTIIMGMLTMTLKELSSDRAVDREKLAGILTKAKQYTERISKIVKGIRALSRDGSRDPFILSRAQDIIDSTFGLCEASIKTNSIQLSYDLEDPEMLIRCRPVQISQVILNLINNSMDAIGDQSSPWIHVGARKVSDEIVEFSVTDSGAGIPENVANQLMQPFFSTKGAGKGTGLGLSISKEIIKAHSGTIALDRDFPNTRFVFQIPIEQNNTKAQAS
jgi:signal transduction histidine kinase